ncbi:MAG: UDP-glucose/GDP-mannose dehydrogenase family protein [Chloroflexi bacterium]|nr:UDP-glucose/GDP-mannose dehydrogenase family protein [Chloroflexota bacterium]
MLISVIGAGYVGLVTGACLAHLGNEVRVVDIDRARIERLRGGEVPIHEPGLDELVAAGLANGRLSFHADQSGTYGSQLVIVAVGTLDRAGEWYGELVERAVRGLAEDSRAPRHLVVRSTLMPGTAVRLEALAQAIDPDVRLCFNPEFTREAVAVRDFLEPDRVVVGAGRDAQALVQELHELYAPMGRTILDTDLTSAETIKLASNVFLATKISFANELARLCAATGADVHAVVDGMGLDLRIGRSFLSPGPGFGGSCFPSQVRALPELARSFGIEAPIIAAVDQSNLGQADWLIDGLERARGASLAGSRVALLGLTFKANTDDLRESPALRLAERLVARGARVVAYDPKATEAGVVQLAAGGVTVDAAPSAAEAVIDADAVVVGTEWAEFGALDWAALAPRMRGRIIADARRIIDRDAALAAGLTVVAMGVTHTPDGGGAAARIAVPVTAAAAV